MKLTAKSGLGYISHEIYPDRSLEQSLVLNSNKTFPSIMITVVRENQSTSIHMTVKRTLFCALLSKITQYFNNLILFLTN